MIQIQNTVDNEWFKWCLVRYSKYADHNFRRITESHNNFVKRLCFKDVKFPVKTRGIHKIKKKDSLGISVFEYEKKEKHPVYVSKKCYKKNMLIYYW